MSGPKADADVLPGAVRRVRLDGVRKQALETGRDRLLVTGVVLAMAYFVVAWRLVDLAVHEVRGEPRLARSSAALAAHSTRTATAGRADVVDRNGVVLATSLPTASLFADPRDVLDPAAAARRLARVLPGLDVARVRARLEGPGSFVWIRRNLTPRQQERVNRLGIPGLRFQRAERRVYPHGREAAHVLGLTDVDGRGLSGIEGQFDRSLRGRGRALELSIDIRVQAMLRRELSRALSDFRALAAAGLVLDPRTGEVLGMVSLPDFDPNLPDTARGAAAFNTVTKGLYEMGSTFKLFTVAMALDSSTVSLGDGYDASKPIRISRFTIRDYHGKRRWLSVPEILVYSSNIGAAKMALDVGAKAQARYLRRLGLLDPAPVELPEVGTPLTPDRWREINTMTIAYGHGIAVSPLQLASAVAALVNGGIMRPPTLIKQGGAPLPGRRVLLQRTSRQMRALMRLVVRQGTGRKAEARGYLVGGKTGSAQKQAAGGYRDKALISSFVGVFPAAAPRFVVLVLVDEPKGNASTKGYATGGWVAAPVVARLVRRLAPLAGIAPIADDARLAADPALLVTARGDAAETRERSLASE